MKQIISAFIVSFLSPCIMGYVTIATPLGPWIAPILALALIGFYKKQKYDALLPVSAGSLGGIIATAFGFSFPTLFFLDAVKFNAFISNPWSCIFFIAKLTFLGGACGLLLARVIRKSMLANKELSFPIGQLIYNTIGAQEQNGQRKQLFWGLGSSLVYGFMQMRSWFGIRLIPESLQLFAKTTLATSMGDFVIPAIRFNMGIIPMLAAIGFIAGAMITLPLLIGAVTQIAFLEPLYVLFFNYLKRPDFVFAFSSGLVLSSALAGIIGVPKQLYDFFSKQKVKNDLFDFSGVSPFLVVILVIALMMFLYEANFSLLSQIYLITTTMLCAYQIVHIAGKIGLALLGRFATFVMVPGLLLFGFDALQITILAIFVELVAGVATDALFSYKAAQMADIDHEKVYKFQAIGLVVSALAMALTIWFLCNYFQFGSEQLFAQRAQGRALLIQINTFDFYAIGVGMLFGYILKYIKINPFFVLGGLLMPLSLSLPLIAGGGLSLVVKKKEHYESFASGIYAANALTMILSVLL